MGRITWVKVAAALMLAALAHVPAASWLHEHDDGPHGDDHCAVCHVRNLSTTETTPPTAATAPALQEHTTVAEAPSFSLEGTPSLHPSRAPPT